MNEFTDITHTEPNPAAQPPAVTENNSAPSSTPSSSESARGWHNPAELDPAAELSEAMRADGDVGIARRFMLAVRSVLKGEPPLLGCAATARACLRKQGQLPISPDDLTTLREWTKGHSDLQRVIDNHKYEDAKAYLAKHESDHLAGKLAGDSNIELHSPDEIFAKYRRIVDAARRAQIDLYRKHISLARFVAESVSLIVKQVADDYQAAEKIEHQKWGVPYNSPSAIILQLRKTEKFVIAQAMADESGNGPKFVFSYLPL